MDLSLKRPGGPPFKLTDIAANSSVADDDLRELKAKIERGEISAEAPCDGMHSEWTPDQTARLKSALKDVLGFKK